MDQIPSPIIIYGEKTEKPRIVTFKIPPSELRLVDKIAIELGLSRSELIRLALNHYIRDVLGYSKD